MQVQGHHPPQRGPFPGNWLAARKADLTPKLNFVDTAMIVLELRFF